MTLILDEDQFFQITANVTSPGYQRIALSGYLVKHKNGETYIAPLLPRMFYGADGAQLGATWRQHIPAAGEQVILSRSGGQPKVGEPDVYWRKIATKEVPKEQVRISLLDQIETWWSSLSTYEKLMWILAGGVVITVAGFTIYVKVKKKAY